MYFLVVVVFSNVVIIIEFNLVSAQTEIDPRCRFLVDSKYVGEEIQIKLPAPFKIY